MYIDAVVSLIEGTLEEQPAPDRLVISFHGIPKAYVERGDPYSSQCQTTFEPLRERIPLHGDRILMTFQSRFGPQEWLQPYTDVTLESLGREGCKSVVIAAPGFTADCLETIEELGLEGKETFHKAGGGTFTRVPCLNDSPAWIHALKQLVLQETGGWQ